MAATTMTPMTSAVRCPRAGCTRAFTCDACLHLHLVRNYRVGYADVFGDRTDAWVDLCEQHEATPPSMLGL